ncbi:hypothetical protein GBAR_LOCUS23638 [Geodia barretti]|uniref:Uncharacterized protein n=1 Tax=Geodia barretti TaxID=519541 RepID=A0AA35T7D9_GEOBA|nr:hypothetical protein GBAR_LOCUS23638 [Geodia barretti]
MWSPPSVTEGGGGGSWVFSYSGAVVTGTGGPGSVQWNQRRKNRKDIFLVLTAH